MLPKYSLKKKSRKNLIFLILQIHFLIFLLISVLWSRNQLKKKFSQTSNPQIVERKATFIPPSKSDKNYKNLK